MASAQKITPNLWFDKNAEEAVRFYTSVFRNSMRGWSTRYGKEGFEVHGMPEGTIMTIEFQLEGQDFVALNGGPHFKFNEAISFIIHCDNQEEVDYFWENLGKGGDPAAQQCGWLKDKFGVSWQIIPLEFTRMMREADQESTERLMHGLLKMKKLDLAELKKAYNGETEKVS